MPERKFLIATHGSFARGIKSSLDIIIGETENIFLIEAYIGENKSIEDELDAVLKTVGSTDELIIFTDLLGGSITNQAIRFALKDNVHVVSGFNLALLIDVLLADADTPAGEVIDSAVENARNQIVYVNKLIKTQQGDSNND